MPIIASADSDKPRELPDADLHNAVCCIVYDLGMRLDPHWGKIQHKVIIGWELEQQMQDGRPFMLSREYTLSLYDKSLLFKHLTSWKGKALTETELRALDLETLVGKMCRINVIHAEVKGKTYANVDAVLPPDKKAKPLTIQLKEPPKWFEAKKAEYASALAAHEAEQAGQPPPPKDEPGQTGSFDEIPF